MLTGSIVPNLFKKSPSIWPLVSRCLISSMADANLSPVEKAKKNAAYKAVDEYVKENMKLGIGSGSTIVYAVNRIAEIVKEQNLQILCVPTSFQARMLIVKNNLPLRSLDECPELDCVIDGADEVDCDLNLIKGGGACQTQEKIVAFNSKKVIIIADSTKDSEQLGEKYQKGIPIEVVPFARTPLEKKIVAKFGGTVELRMGKMKAGPVITDNGNFVLDWKFPKDESYEWEKIDTELNMLPGVVETGLFVNLAGAVYFGQPDGSVKVVKTKDY